MELDDSVHEEVQRLCAEGDERAQAGNYPDALKRYWAAWDLLPEPRTQWEAATWILAAVGDANFLSGDFAAGRDNLALAIRSDAPQHEPQLTGAERASIAEALAAAAERLDDLKSAQSYLDAAIQLHPPNQRDSLRRKFQTLTAELQRRAKNAARQPVVRNVIEQGTIVAPRILRSVQ